MDIKENLAQNLIRYRKAMNLTQAELAEKLNYSDKAVSKWERAESVPDLYVLKQIADFYDVTIDTLIAKPKFDKPHSLKNLGKRRVTIGLCAVGLVWLVAMCCFAFMDIIIPTIKDTWLSFVCAIPISLIVLLILTSVWGKSLTNTIIVSLLVWTTILTVYLVLNSYLPNTPKNLWEVFLIGIPLQGLIIFWFLYRKMR